VGKSGFVIASGDDGAGSETFAVGVGTGEQYISGGLHLEIRKTLSKKEDTQTFMRAAQEGRVSRGEARARAEKRLPLRKNRGKDEAKGECWVKGRKV